MKYNAFLSYSHAADNALAPALQLALHRLARPWYRMRALRVFRDKTSLAASPELWPAIVAALSEAEYFLLLASPAAAASRWVQREIEWWLEHRSVQKMLILVTEGDLVWDETADDIDWQRTNALPSLLQGRFATEPLWVDLRWAKSGETLDLRHAAFRLAVLDIAAPLHGRSKDELDGEDVRQFARTRRLAGSAITALALLTISSIAAAIFAVRQRDEALRQSTTAQAGRLAAQADLLRERGGPVDDSVMLGAEALRMLDSIGTRSMEADLTLRRSLAQLPRALGAFEIGTDDQLEIASGGRHVTLRGVADQVSVRQLPGGEVTGCRWDAIAAQLAAAELPKAAIIQATTSTGSHCATVAPDAGTAQRVIDIWSSAPLARIASVPHPGTGNLRLALSDDAEFLAISNLTEAPAQRELRLWSRSRGADVLRETDAAFIAFGPDHQLFATTNGVWRLPAPAESKAARVLAWSRDAWAIAFSRNGRSIVMRTAPESEAAVWSLEGAKPDTLPPTPAPGAPAGTPRAISDDGRFIVFDTELETAVLWDNEQSAERAQVPIEPLAAVFEGRETIVLANELQSTQTRRALVFAMPRSGAALARIGASPDDPVVWLGVGEKQVERLIHTVDAVRIDSWAWETGEVHASVEIKTQRQGPWAVSADGRRFAVGRSGGVVLGAADGSGRTREIAMAQVPLALALHARGDVLAAATTDVVQTWKLDSGEHWTAPLEAGLVAALRLSDDRGYLIAVVGALGEAPRSGVSYRLQRWRIGDAAKPLVVALGAHLNAPDLGCLVSGDGSIIVADGKRLDFAAAAASAPRIGESDPGCVRIGGKALRAGIEGEHVTVTDSTSGQPVARLDHPAPVRHVALSADDRLAATLDDRGDMRVWALTPADLIAQACARKPRALSAEAWSGYMPASITSDVCGRARVAGTKTR